VLGFVVAGAVEVIVLISSEQVSIQIIHNFVFALLVWEYEVVATFDCVYAHILPSTFFFC
jgi:hypothetical protein